jgi:hypothetical protein
MGFPVITIALLSTPRGLTLPRGWSAKGGEWGCFEKRHLKNKNEDHETAAVGIMYLLGNSAPQQEFCFFWVLESEAAGPPRAGAGPDHKADASKNRDFFTAKTQRSPRRRKEVGKTGGEAGDVDGKSYRKTQSHRE